MTLLTEKFIDAHYMYIMDMQNKKELFLIIYVIITGSEDRHMTNVMLNKSLFLILSV